MQSNITMVLGASPNPERYSYMATVMLLEKGQAIYPYGIKKGMIQSLQIEQEWPIPGSINTLTLYLGPTAQVEYYDQIIALKPQRIIFNPGTENPDFQTKLIKAGIEVEEACTLVLLSLKNY